MKHLLKWGKARSLSQKLDGPDLFIGIGLACAIGLLYTGVSIPAFDVTQFFFFTDRFSILGSISTLISENEWGIALLIAVFSLAFPSLKLIALAKLLWWDDINHDSSRRTLKLITFLGKWSMADVFVVALLILSVKSNILANAQTAPGIYAFAASALIAMGISLRIQNLLETP